jgi:hypothetical protein
MFERLTGMSIQRAQYIPDELESRAMRRMSRDEAELYWDMRAYDQRMLRDCA